MTFPKDFVWGTAAASYQIEGAAQEDGKGLSVWDMFSKKPGAIWNGHTGDIACNHYHRYAEDVRLMQDIGVKAYRLSISWPRVLPEGTGTPNAAGLAFYDRLIDALLAAGIEPWVTLFHWDYPLALYYRGGWLNRDTVDWFADYAALVAQKLSDRVSHWMTLNEPQVFIGAGHYEGRHAPGDQLRFKEVLRAGHHALLAHGKAVQAIRASAKKAPRVGVAPVGQPKLPATDSRADVEAARRATFAANQRSTWINSWWMDPIYLGEYPAEGWRFFGSDVPPLRSGDMELIAQDLDFFGVNIYEAFTVRAAADGSPEPVPYPVGHPLTSFDWNVTPSALYWGPRFFHERYKKPIVITENGVSVRDWVSLDGKVHDPARIDFIQRHLLEYERASAGGVPIEGYFYWSFIDNFEWGHGYKQRFGLIHCDYPTGTRTPKDSAAWYSEVIRTNGASLHG